MNQYKKNKNQFLQKMSEELEDRLDARYIYRSIKSQHDLLSEDFKRSIKDGDAEAIITYIKAQNFKSSAQNENYQV